MMKLRGTGYGNTINNVEGKGMDGNHIDSVIGGGMSNTRHDVTTLMVELNVSHHNNNNTNNGLHYNNYYLNH